MLITKFNTVPERLAFSAVAICPFLAASSTIVRSFVLCMAIMISLVLSQIIALILVNGAKIKLNLFITVVISAFSVTLVQIFVNSMFQTAQQAVGVVLSCMSVSVLAVTSLEEIGENANSKEAFGNGFFSGVYFVLAMMAMSFVRELFGQGTLFAKLDGSLGLVIFGEPPLPILSTTAGALMLCALILGIYEAANKKGSEEK